MNQSYAKKGYLLEDFRLFHLKDQGETKVDYHYHEFYKLLFFISGSGEYVVEGKRYSLLPGDIVLIGTHCVHRPEFSPDIPCERMILYISPEFLHRESSVTCDLTECFSKEYDHVLRPTDPIRKSLFTRLVNIEKELSSTHYGKEILSNGLLLGLMVEIARSIRHKEVQKPEPMLPKSKRMLDMVQYLDAHLTEDLNIDLLADKFFISRYHLMRRFREETGTTIHAYISDRRLMLARDLIIQGIPATEACFQCGFGSYSSFSRAYGKFFGTTPTGRELADSLLEETFE
jgi:AraC-like DNA-binding protein